MQFKKGATVIVLLCILIKQLSSFIFCETNLYFSSSSQEVIFILLALILFSFNINISRFIIFVVSIKYISYFFRPIELLNLYANDIY